MKWQEARELFPNQFLLVSILDYHYEGDKKIVDEIAPIRPIKDENANEDTIYEAYGIGGSVPFYTKIMDSLKIDRLTVENVEVDVGMLLPKEHPALLGLDVLKQYNFIIDLGKLKLYPSTQ
ncbi:hypothetical protein [Lentibacillus sp. Marseille-P4043]|uniref:hypothetical protein n=1 Tax=Lentibacillus sp. Marseille-P4043 TaxID=2040293 RepID=UPI000D0BB0F3|nr:hypothetical protein [Lentibacillus sp. Marseille-P4043]